MPTSHKTEKPYVLIVDQPLGPAAHHGLAVLRRTLQQRGVAFREGTGIFPTIDHHFILVTMRESSNLDIVRIMEPVTLPRQAEAVLIKNIWGLSTQSWLIAGGDDRGLMYALLDVAQRIGWAAPGEAPLAHVVETEEAPFVRERSLSIYTMHKAYFESRFFDEDYWRAYLDMLAADRFNTLALLFGYESSGYMAPPYPYFFDVEGFPEVRVRGWDAAQQARYLHALNRLLALCHERGLRITLGIWDHIYRGGVQQGALAGDGAGDADPLYERVLGLSDENLMPYSVAALAKLLRLVPNVDTLQFRMHGESGLTGEEMDRFWAQIYDVMLEHGQGVGFDARVKGFPDRLIDLALEKGVPIRLCTKYWMEQMGMPFHPTHVHPQNQHDRRHSYADLLRYPRRYAFLWRLWNGGTNRVLLWGDPDYARRFAASTRLYDGDGFDVNEPLATKMAAQDHALAPFELLQPPYRHYRWEFQRYWPFYRLFGRLGYNPDTPADVWETEFARRFGGAGATVQKALALASRILPRIVAYTYPYNLFPTTRGWVEKERMEDLPAYAQALPSDTEQFASLAEEAERRIAGGGSGKIRPQATSAWFEATAARVLELVDQAQALIDDHAGLEFAAVSADLRILAHLARYHARRIPAALHWLWFRHSGDRYELNDAIAHEEAAIGAWRDLVAAADDVYHHDLRMGRVDAGLGGHWRDELAALERGLAALRAEGAAHVDEGLAIRHVPVRRWMPGQALTVRATVTAPEGEDVGRVWVRYATDQGDWRTAPLLDKGGGRHRATIPAEEVLPGLRYAIHAVDSAGREVIWPEDGEALAVLISADREPPTVAHRPRKSAPAGQPLTLRARVHDPSGVAWVRLRYRPVNQYLDFSVLEMQPMKTKGSYTATIPGEALDPTYDLMYLIEAMDGAGNGVLWPSLEEETPYIIVSLKRQG
jgi:hypothetical protein